MVENMTEDQKIKEELKKARELAKRRGKVLEQKKSLSGTTKFPFKDVGKLEAGKDYYAVLFSPVPLIGAVHWFEVLGDDGKLRLMPKNCTANLRDDDSFGANPDVCPACWLARYEQEYFIEHQTMPKGCVPLDMYKDKYSGAQIAIYYYALIGEPYQIEKVLVSATGEETTRMEVRIKWEDEPTLLRIKPSINDIFLTHLNNVDEYGGDITAYLWKLHKRAENNADKYKDTAPVIQKGSLVPVPAAIKAKQAEYLKSLPTANEVFKPVPADEMAEALKIPEWSKMKAGKLKPTDDFINVGSEDDSTVFVVDDNDASDTENVELMGVEDDLDLSIDTDMPFDE